MSELLNANVHFAEATAEADEPVPVEFFGQVSGNGQGERAPKSSGGADRAKNASGKGEERFPLVTSAALDQADYTPTPIITEALFEGIPAVIGAPFKTCKSLVGIDGAISTASGTPWLGSWTVPSIMRVVYFSGEGGPCAAQDYARRIAASKGLELGDVSQLSWCFSVPRLEDVRNLDAFCKVLDDTGAKVVFLDNLMLCLSGDDANNLYKMGGILGHVIRRCAERDVTPVFIHHFKRQRSTTDPYAPGELADLAWAGASEIAGQWWLLTRRQRYDPDQAGEHKLWLTIGGRVGHSSLHALEIHEGRRSDPGGRRWEVDVFSADDAQRAEQRDRQSAKAAEREARKQEQLKADRQEVVQPARKLAGPAGLAVPVTETDLRGRVSFGSTRLKKALASLVADGTMRMTTIRKSNHQEYPAYILAPDSDG